MKQIRNQEPSTFWKKHVLEWYGSINEPKSEYCKRKGLVLHQFTYWDGLTQFLNDGELEIDNNATEREIKILVMARKNFLFAYSVEGAEALGIYFSMIQSARAHGIEPEEYLTEIFKEIPLCKSIEDYEKLLPWNIKHRLNKKIQGTENAKERIVA
jgi:transposase